MKTEPNVTRPYIWKQPPKPKQQYKTRNQAVAGISYCLTANYL